MYSGQTNIKIPGIDVSEYQKTINWGLVAKSGIKFAILRTVLRSGELDTTFEYNYTNATANNISVFGYIYSYSLSTSEAISHANNLINKLKGKMIPIYLDLEWDNQRSLGVQGVTEIAKAFISTLKSRGYEVNIYSSLDWYNNAYNSNQLKALGCKFWIAIYGKNTGDFNEKWKPNDEVYIWQYTSAGSVSGIQGNVDLNMMYIRVKPVEKLIKVTASSGLRRRDLPNGSIIGALSFCGIHQVKGITLDGEWYVGIDGKYFSAKPGNVADLVGRIKGDGVRIRAGPGTDQNILGALSTQHTVTGLTKQGDWFYCKTSVGITGWVSSTYIDW